MSKSFQLEIINVYLQAEKTAKNFKSNINLNQNVMSDVAAKVKEIIVEKLGVDPSEVTENASFTNDLGADSLDIVELVMDFEKQFGIEIPDDDAGDKIATVGDAIKYIEEKVNA